MRANNLILGTVLIVMNCLLLLLLAFSFKATKNKTSRVGFGAMSVLIIGNIGYIMGSML